MSRGNLDKYFGDIITKSWKTNQLGRILPSLFNEMSANNYIPNTSLVELMIDSCKSSNNDEIALKILKADGFPINYDSYSSLIDIFQKKKHWQNAFTTLDLMEKRNQNNSNENNNNTSTISHEPIPIDIYNKVMDTCVQADQSDMAMNILLKINQSGYVPNAISWNTALNACAKSRQWDTAQTIINHWKQQSGSDNQPDLFSYNILLNICKQLDKSYEVNNIMNDITNAGLTPDSVTYNTIIQIYQKANNLEKCFTFFNDMRRANVKPDIITYRSILGACSKRGAYEKIDMILRYMEEDGCKPDKYCYSAMSKSYGNSGKWEKAIEVIDKMKIAGISPDVVNYNCAMGACVKAGNWNACEKLLHQMTWHDKIIPDSDSFAKMMYAFYTSGKDDSSKRVSKMMKDMNIKPDMTYYRVLIDICCKSGKYMEASKILDDMYNEGLSPTTAINNNVIKNFCEANLIENAENVLRKMKEHHIKPDALSYGPFLSFYGRRGRLQKSERIYNEMKENEIPFNLYCYTMLIHSYIRSGKIANNEKVVNIVETVKNDNNIKIDLKFYNTVLKIYSKTGDFTKAELLLREMNSQSDIEPNVDSYNGIMGAYLRGAQYDKTWTVLRRMERENILPNVMSYSFAYTACIKGGAKGKTDIFLNKLTEQVLNGKKKDAFSVKLSLWAASKKKNPEELAKKIYQIAKDELKIRYDIDSYHFYMDSFVKTKNWRPVVKAISSMIEDDIKPGKGTFERLWMACGGKQSFNGNDPKWLNFYSLLRTYTYLKDTSKVEKLCQRTVNTSQFKRNHAAKFNSAISASADKGEWKLAVDLLNTINERDRNMKPHRQHYLETIRACCEAQEWDKASQFFIKALNEDVIDKNIFSFNEIMKYYEKAGNWRKIETIMFTEMKKYNIEPDLESFKILLNALHKAHAWEKSTYYCLQVKDQGFTFRNSEDYFPIIFSLAFGHEAPKWSKIKELLQEMDKLCIKVDLKIFNLMLGACSKSADFIRAESITNDLRERSLVPNNLSYNLLMSSYKKGGKIREVDNVIKKMRSEGLEPDIVASTMSIYGLALQGKWDDVNRMKNELAVNHALDIAVFNSLLDVCRRKQMWYKTEDILKEILDSGLLPDFKTCDFLVEGYVRRGKIEEAELFINRMRTEWCLVPNQRLYTYLLREYARKGWCDKAWEVYREISQLESYKPSLLEYTHIASSFVNASEFPVSPSKIFQEMDYYGLEPTSNIRKSMILACVTSGYWNEGAEMLYELMKYDQRKMTFKNYKKLDFYNNVLQKFADAGQAQLVVQIIKNMNKFDAGIEESIQIGIDMCTKNGTPVLELLELLCYNKNPQNIDLKIFSRCIAISKWKTAWYILNTLMVHCQVVPNIDCYHSAMKACARDGQFEKVEELLWSIESESFTPTAETYNIVIKACAEAKEWCNVEMHIETMREKGYKPDSKISNIIINTYVGNQEEEIERSIVNM